jgi:3-oxoacyl-[acyl-carrier protein] reductase
MHPELEQAFSLTGRAAVVTGAGKGIGRQAAITFAQAGADIYAVDVDEAGLAETETLLKATGQRFVTARVDVSAKREVDALAAAALREFARLDIWANVAGIIRYSAIVDTTEADLMAILNVNLLGVYWGTAAAGRIMSDAGRGSIINISSAGGEVPAPMISVYGMTKAAIIHLTKTAAVELGQYGVRANAVAPGFIDTPMNAHYWVRDDGSLDPDAKRQIMTARSNQSPLRITGETTDITYAMLYLASDASRFMTGEVVRPNGGVFMA